MIKSIRVTRDQFAAENHSADSFFVEVITQPGIGPVRTGFRYGIAEQRDGRPQRIHADQGCRTDAELRVEHWRAGSIQNKASFSLSVNGNSSYDTPNSAIARSTGTGSRR